MQIVFSDFTVDCQVNYTRRKKSKWDDLPLHFSKCYELANYYLGFNGWTTKIVTVSHAK